MSVQESPVHRFQHGAFKLRRRLGFSFAALALLGASAAAEAGQTLYNLEVKSVGTGWGAEGVYIETSTSVISAEGCGPRFLISASHPLLKVITALLVSAQQTGMRVNLYVEGCQGTEVMVLKAASVNK